MADDQSGKKRGTPPDVVGANGEDGTSSAATDAGSAIAWPTLEAQLNALQENNPQRRITRVYATCTPQVQLFTSIYSGAEVVPAQNPPRAQFCDGEVVVVP